MKERPLKIRTVALLAVALSLLAASPAAATTFCVPSFHAACPNSGGNVAVAGLQTALDSNGDDGAPDRILIAAGVTTGTDTFDYPSGDNDDLEIVGAGPAATAVTLSATGNKFVLNLDGPRDVTVRDLTVRVPASFTDDLGGAIQAEQDTFENVDIESRNPSSDGAYSMIGGGTFRDGRVYGSNGGSIDTAFSGNGAQSGVLTVERTVIEDASWGILSDDPEVAVYARRVAIHDPVAYGVRISDGAFMVLENAIVEATTGTPIVAAANDAGTVIATVRHTTIVGSDVDPGDPAIEATDSGAGSVNLVVSDVIAAGYDDPLRCQAPDAPNSGSANFTISYSYFAHSANVLGDCNLVNSNTVDALDPQVGEPQFAGAGDYRLPLGSPAIDSGNPATVNLPTVDFLGALRPADGDGDGNARRDMGAYEVQPASPPPVGGGDPPPSGGGPTDPPATKPTFGADTLVTLALASRRIAPGKPLRVRVTNRNAFAVTGKLGARTVRAFAAAKGKRRLAVKPKPLTLAAGARKTVTLKLSKRLRGLLASRGKLTLRLNATVRSPAGDVRSVPKRITPRLKQISARR